MQLLPPTLTQKSPKSCGAEQHCNAKRQLNIFNVECVPILKEHVVVFIVVHFIVPTYVYHLKKIKTILSMFSSNQFSST